MTDNELRALIGQLDAGIRAHVDTTARRQREALERKIEILRLESLGPIAKSLAELSTLDSAEALQKLSKSLSTDKS